VSCRQQTPLNSARRCQPEPPAVSGQQLQSCRAAPLHRCNATFRHCLPAAPRVLRASCTKYLGIDNITSTPTAPDTSRSLASRVDIPAGLNQYKTGSPTLSTICAYLRSPPSIDLSL
jgi:hypothetical protein